MMSILHCCSNERHRHPSRASRRRAVATLDVNAWHIRPQGSAHWEVELELAVDVVVYRGHSNNPAVNTRCLLPRLKNCRACSLPRTTKAGY